MTPICIIVFYYIYCDANLDQDADKSLCHFLFLMKRLKMSLQPSWMYVLSDCFPALLL